MTIRDIAVAISFEPDEQSIKKTNSEIDKTAKDAKKKADDIKKSVNDSVNSIKSTVTKALGLIGAGISLIKTNQIIEEFKGINDKIRDATRSMGNQAKIQQTILDTANDATVVECVGTTESK